MKRTTFPTIIPSLAPEAEDMALDRLLAPARHFKNQGCTAGSPPQSAGEARCPLVLGIRCLRGRVNACATPASGRRDARFFRSNHRCAVLTGRGNRGDSCRKCSGNRSGRVPSQRMKVGDQPMVTKVSRAFRLQMEGYGLTTAEIHYHLPDHPSLLQLFVWQEYDLAPHFPSLKGFLSYWEREMEGPLHSVRVAHSRLIRPSEWKAVDRLISLN